jgi:short-subunit dehydrogenase
VRNELRGSGVTATALCPGPVATGFDAAAGFSAGERAAVLPGFMSKSADEAARAGVDGLAANKGHVVPGRANRLAAAFCRARRTMPCYSFSRVVPR